MQASLLECEETIASLDKHLVYSCPQSAEDFQLVRASESLQGEAHTPFTSSGGASALN